MKTPLLSLTLAAMFVALSADYLHGQAGNDNPTGPAGFFNGNVATGGSYDPYTGNATRSVTDIAIPNAAGTYPLAFTRTANSRLGGGAWFGYSGGWRHNYGWSLNLSETHFVPGFNPLSYSVFYPDGRSITFVQSSTDTLFRSARGGIGERFMPLNRSTMLCYLVMSDGGKVEFRATLVDDGVDPETQQHSYYYTYAPQAIIDPFGLRTNFSYPADGSLTITEPAGRWLKVFYGVFNGYNVITSVRGSDGRVVLYTYSQAAFSPGTRVWPYLSSITYYGDNTLKAYYTYQAPNLPDYNGVPLLKTCDDAMYGGPMRQIKYIYATANNPDGTVPVYGQIRSENNFTTGQAVSTLTINNAGTRTEARGDGPARTFTYAAGMLTSWRDFEGFSMSQTRDANGYLNSFTDANLHTTNMTREAITGRITTLTHPPDNNGVRYSVTYGYTDPANPYYLDHVANERNFTTYYRRDANDRVYRIDYPDAGYESYLYNPFDQITSHRLKAGGTESFAYDGRGLKTEYRDPYHTGGNPTARYQYDALGRVSGVTDALGTALGDVNHTTNYAYNTRGQVKTTTHPTDPTDNLRHTILNGYNPDGTLQSVTDELGHVTSYIYDNYRRLTSVTTPQRFSGDTTPRTTTFNYQRWGTNSPYLHTSSFVFIVTAPSGRVTHLDCDNNFRKAILRQAPYTADDAWTYFNYDAVGNLSSTKNPRGYTTTYGYDKRDRLTSIDDPIATDRNSLGDTVTYGYDPAGNKTSERRANNQVITYDNYDSMNHLLQQTAKQAPTPDAVTKYTYDATGLLQTMQDPRLVATSSAETYSYDYDLMGRKTTVTYPLDTAGVRRRESWTYDVADCLKTFTNRAGNVQTLTYDALNRATLSQWNDAGVTPSVTTTYDAAARVTGITNGNATITRTYFNDNLLKSETTRPADAVNRTVTYAYDADGRRASLQYPNGAYSYNYTYTGRGQLDNVINSASGGAPPIMAMT